MKQELTRRELEVVSMAANGLTAKQTADVLGIGVSAVSLYMANCQRKLGAQTKAHAAAIATAKGLIEADYLAQSNAR